MSWIRISAISLSVLFHSTLAYALLDHETTAPIAAFDKGTGNDQIFVEQGIAVEGLAKLGNDMETIEATDAVPVAESPPPTPVEAKPIEQLHDVISSDSSTVKDSVVKSQEPPPQNTPPPPQVVAAAAPPVQSTIAMEQSSGKQRLGSRSNSLRSKYLRKLRTVIERAKFNPRTRTSGTVWLEFKISPNGELLARTIKKSSGSKVLDNAAIAAVERAAPFPVMPKEISDKPMVVSVPFKFITR